MKKILGICFVSAVISLMSYGKMSDQNKSEIVTVKTNIYCDHCKECESCGGKIQRDLSFDKGILQVDLDEKLMTIKVEYNPKKTTPEEIRRKISMYGYDADDVKADSLAVTKLDGCCLKK